MGWQCLFWGTWRAGARRWGVRQSLHGEGPGPVMKQNKRNAQPRTPSSEKRSFVLPRDDHCSLVLKYIFQKCPHLSPLSRTVLRLHSFYVRRRRPLPVGACRPAVFLSAVARAAAGATAGGFVIRSPRPRGCRVTAASRRPHQPTPRPPLPVGRNDSFASLFALFKF